MKKTEFRELLEKGFRACSHCKRELSLEENFHKNTRGSTGYASKCKDCKRKLTVRAVCPEGFKQCSRCREIKPFSDYNKNKSMKNGLSYECIDCKRKYREELRNREKPEISLKTCKICNQELTISNFMKSDSSSDGYHARCKDCLRQVQISSANENHRAITEKKCTRCNENLPVSLFNIQNTSHDGYHSHCKFCSQRKDTSRLTWSKRTITAHRINGHRVDIIPEDLSNFADTIDKCQFCGIELLWKNDKGIFQQNSPTLENLDLNHTLTMENCVIICHKCNKTKSDTTLDSYIKLLETILPNLKKLKEERNLPEEESLPIIPSF